MRPTLRPPHLAEHRVLRQVDAHVHGRAVGVAHRLDRQVVEVQLRVRLLLPAVGGEVLLEVAVAIQQPDADQRHAQFAGALQVIPGQNPQTAGVDRQRLVQPELGREVRHLHLRLVGVGLVEPALARRGAP